MKTAYHFNPETGKTGTCSAKVKDCAFAVNGETPEHYKTAEEAQTAYEQQMSSQLLSNSVSKIQKEDFKELTDEDKAGMRESFNQAKDTFKDLGADYDVDESITEEERIQQEKEDVEFMKKLDNLIQESKSHYSREELAYSEYLSQTYNNKENLIEAYNDSQKEYEDIYSADYKKDKDHKILDRRIQIIDSVLLSANEGNEENLDLYSDKEIKQYLHDKQLVLQQQYSLYKQELMSLDAQNQELTKSSTNSIAGNRKIVLSNLKRSNDLEEKSSRIKNEYSIPRDLRRKGFDQDKNLHAYLKAYVHQSNS